MLVSAKEMLTKAKEGHYAVGQFNINNLEWTKAILLTAQEMNSPVILGEVGGQAVLGRQDLITTPWLTERHGYDPTSLNGQKPFFSQHRR